MVRKQSFSHKQALSFGSSLPLTVAKSKSPRFGRDLRQNTGVMKNKFEVQWDTNLILSLARSLCLLESAEDAEWEIFLTILTGLTLHRRGTALRHLRQARIYWIFLFFLQSQRLIEERKSSLRDRNDLRIKEFRNSSIYGSVLIPKFPNP